MAIEYFCAYHSYLEMLEPLTDSERGRLFTACLEYSRTGEAPQLNGNERFLFPAFRAQIDRDAEKYRRTCDANREKAAKRWRLEESSSMPQHTTASNSMPVHIAACTGRIGNAADANEKGKEKEKANNTSPPQTSGGHKKSYDIQDIEELSHFDLPKSL